MSPPLFEKDKLEPPSFAKHPVDGGEFQVNPALPPSRSIPEGAAQGAYLNTLHTGILLPHTPH